jgi:hypothetical protein
MYHHRHRHRRAAAAALDFSFFSSSPFAIVHMTHDRLCCRSEGECENEKFIPGRVWSGEEEATAAAATSNYQML